MWLISSLLLATFLGSNFKIGEAVVQLAITVAYYIGYHDPVVASTYSGAELEQTKQLI